MGVGSQLGTRTQLWRWRAAMVAQEREPFNATELYTAEEF